METMRAEAAESWDESPIDAYFRLRREAVMIEAQAAERLAEFDRDGSFVDAGHLSATALLQADGDSGREASRRVGEARALRRHPEIREGYTTAVLDRPRVAMLLAAARVAPEVFERDERVLVDTISSLSAGDARRAVEYWKQAADQRLAAADAEHVYRRRRLDISETLGGMIAMDAGFDAEAGQTVITALRSITDPQQLDPDDDRTPTQRRCDAMTDICGYYLTHQNPPLSGGSRPQVSAVVSLAALQGEPGAPCAFDDGTVIGAETARRIACDSSVTRVITGPRSEVLDVGRATRTIPAAIRKALIIRDRHCRFPGCERPHRWCDAHHIQHWARRRSHQT